jgi:hypothetical protein
MAQSHQSQVEALSEISDIIVQISDEDLIRLESLAEEITQFNQDLGSRILDACSLLTRVYDDVESALERLEPDTEDAIEGDEDLEDAEAIANETEMEDEEDEDEEERKPRSKHKK